MEDIDMNRLYVVETLMKDKFLALIESFLLEINQHYNQLEQAINESDDESLKFLSHSIAGSSINMGCNKVYSLCKAIENAKDNQRVSTALKTLPYLETAIASVKRTLIQYT